MDEADQLEAIGQLHELLQSQGIEYWLFGGWAVDFHAGAITRSHDDIDIAVWLHNLERIDRLLAADGWIHHSAATDDGYTTYERGPVQLEVAFLARADDGRVYTPANSGSGSWPSGSFENDRAELRGVHVRIVNRRSLTVDKSERRSDPVVAVKDRADLATLSTVAAPSALNAGEPASGWRRVVENPGGSPPVGASG